MSWETVVQDVRYGLRVLIKEPAFAVLAVLTIAVGIGGTTSIFSIIDAVLLQPLPYAHSEQLLEVFNADPARGLPSINVSFPKLGWIQKSSRTLTSTAGLYPTTVSLKDSSLPTEIAAAQVSRNFFEVFEVSPALGRVFRPEEDAPGGEFVGIVSHRLWVTHLGADPTVIGRTITVDGNPMTVIGVLPAQFHFLFRQPEPDIWLPRVFENPMLGPTRIQSGAGYMQVYARARTDVTLDEVKRDLQNVHSSYRAAHPGFADIPGVLLATPLKESLVGQIRPSLLTLFAAIASVLLIGCTNLMNLLLAKGTGRKKELAVRLAVGATRTRLVRQLLTEALVLSILGGTGGILIALASKWLLRLLPVGTLPRAEAVSLSASVALFSALLTLASALFFGLVPAFRASGVDVQGSLKETSRGTSSSRRSKRGRALLIGGEVALAVLLLSGAGVLIKSFSKLVRVDPGFDPNRAVTMAVPLPAQRYPMDKQRKFFRELVASVQTLPKLDAVGAVNALPLVGVSPLVYCCPAGAACQGIGKDPLISTRMVTPGFFPAMGIPLVRGRLLEDRDNENAQRVVLINETAAKAFFHDQDPIGKTIANSRDMKPLTIVGVVKDVRFGGLATPAFQEMYIPHSQADRLHSTMTLVVRSDSSPGPLADAVKRRVAALDPDIPVTDILTMNEAVAESIAQPRLTTQIGALFAVLALLLTVIGIYGVLAYSVSQQTQQIGIRMALGATPRNVVALILREGIRVVLAGLVVGLVACLALMRLLKSLLFGTSTNDPAILLAATATILLAALLACYIPARRAGRVSPVEALQL